VISVHITFDSASRGAAGASEGAIVDEQANTGPDKDAEDDKAQQREERFQRLLTQRELVRASLLRCPPPERAEPPRR
jgi:hypothetical protein